MVSPSHDQHYNLGQFSLIDSYIKTNLFSLPETNSLPPKMDGWKMKSLFRDDLVSLAKTQSAKCSQPNTASQQFLYHRSLLMSGVYIEDSM